MLRYFVTIAGWHSDKCSGCWKCLARANALLRLPIPLHSLEGPKKGLKRLQAKGENQWAQGRSSFSQGPKELAEQDVVLSVFL